MNSVSFGSTVIFSAFKTDGYKKEETEFFGAIKDLPVDTRAGLRDAAKALRENGNNDRVEITYSKEPKKNSHTISISTDNSTSSLQAFKDFKGKNPEQIKEIIIDVYKTLTNSKGE